MLTQYVATFDIGSSVMKGLLINQSGIISNLHDVDLHTSLKDQSAEQDPQEWWDAFITITKNWFVNGIDPKQIVAITFSGHMQDLITLDDDGTPLKNAILYSDNRATTQADLIKDKFPDITTLTGNPFDSTSPLAKWLWLKEHEPDIENQTKTLLFGPKDYLIFRLTGQKVVDPTNASTLSLMSLTESHWINSVLKACDLDSSKLPNIRQSHEIVGRISQTESVLTGFAEGTLIFCGFGDAGSTSLGAGVIQEHDQYIYLGTTGWVASATSHYYGYTPGHFQLKYFKEALFIDIASSSNSGNVHSWAVQQFSQGDYHLFEKQIGQTEPAADGLLFLPYLNGQRSPIPDPHARGAFIGITNNTTTKHMCRAVLEGLCFSFRQLIDLKTTNHLHSQTFYMIGGGTKSATWCQIMADVCGIMIKVPENAQYLPALGAAASPFIKLGWESSYEAFAENILSTRKSITYHPNPVAHSKYEKSYEHFKKIYPAINHLVSVK
ncbi:hypothetical protein GMB86_15060 [Terrilactibacillus sp. BCM23-1]|uniref:Carbohydrate kinase n=1 Tax=Terrilactibacillus tamarindi TaxID=2599694 RepID=A0A6N8CUC8_9BACI|nr:FGGY family carbohydrate kinase [Terrilactibacillus tamarindi]MTT33318.1 hypothetical protein [Terrilactibacillus tamarindi]